MQERKVPIIIAENPPYKHCTLIGTHDLKDLDFLSGSYFRYRFVSPKIADLLERVGRIPTSRVHAILDYILKEDPHKVCVTLPNELL